MQAYIVITGVIFFFFGVVWNKKDLPNAIIKVALYLMAAWSFYVLFEQPVQHFFSR